MTHLEIASAIRNRIADGLDGNLNNQALSVEQLLEEIDLQRADFVHKYAMSQKLDTKYLMQKLEGLTITCENISDDCLIRDCGENVPTVFIPKLLPVFGDTAIEYIGLTNMQESFAVYFHPDDVRNHRVRMKTRHRPFVWVDTAPNEDESLSLRFFNWDSYDPLKYVTVRGIFEHPLRVKPGQQDTEYPAPLHMQNAIIDVLAEKYVRFFRQLNIPPVPNTQSDQVT